MTSFRSLICCCGCIITQRSFDDLSCHDPLLNIRILTRLERAIHSIKYWIVLGEYKPSARLHAPCDYYDPSPPKCGVKRSSVCLSVCPSVCSIPPSSKWCILELVLLLLWNTNRRPHARSRTYQGRSDGGISVYIPTKSVPGNYFVH